MTRRGPKYNPAAMTEQPAVSVIVLGWNGRQYVAPCLTSLLAQDFDRPYEILFVDNGSTDGTADLAERHAGVRVHRLDRNYGYCLGNNKGFELARARAAAGCASCPPPSRATRRSRPATPTSSSPGTRSTRRRSWRRPWTPPTPQSCRPWASSSTGRCPWRSASSIRCSCTASPSS